MRQICGNAIEMSEKKKKKKGENAKREKGTIIEYIYNEIINKKCKKILNFIKQYKGKLISNSLGVAR